MQHSSILGTLRRFQLFSWYCCFNLGYFGTLGILAPGILDFGYFGHEYLGLWVFWPRVFWDFGYFGLGYFGLWVFWPRVSWTLGILAMSILDFGYFGLEYLGLWVFWVWGGT